MATRRQFIRTVVLSTGAVFLDWPSRAKGAGERGKSVVPKTGGLDFKKAHAYLKRDAEKPVLPKPTVETDVVVVGGGLSGLTAAWNLKRAGKKVLVVEHEGVAGGLARGDGGVDLGAIRFSRLTPSMKALCDGVGVTPVQLPGDSYWLDGLTIVDDMWSEAMLRTQAIKVGSPETMRHFRNFMLAFDPCPSFPIADADPVLVQEYDSMDGMKIIQNFPSADLADWLDMFTLTTMGRSLHKTNPYAFYALFPTQLGPSFGMHNYSFVGGMRSLAGAITDALGSGAVRTGSLAIDVRNADGGVQVSVITNDGPVTIAAKGAVVATAKHNAARIVHDLPGLQQYKMTQVPQFPGLTVQLVCNAPLMPQRSFITWFRDPTRTFSYIHDASFLADQAANNLERASGPFVYLVHALPPEGDLQSMERDEFLAEFAQRVVGAILSFKGNAYGAIDELRVFSWGHARTSPQMGMIGQLHRGLADPFGRITFAGADNELMSTVENAVGTGAVAATQLLAML
jgi:hypothetical protein